MTDLQNWTSRPKPERKIFEGRYVRLEPLNAQKHGDELFAASSVEDAEQRFTWLFETPPATRAEFEPWLDKASKSDDPLFFAVIDKASGKVAGRQALMRIDPANGVIEIGSIYWGPLISRRPAATEAQFLFMQYVFDVLGYRRYEWKCHNENGLPGVLPSVSASGLRAFSASIWWSRAGTGIRRGSPFSTANGLP
ncbi:hypothetical protein B968_02064 [Brucella suis F8/06-3]|nr:hypothetical protein B968_02064 [Brucella suis F8/06-3]